MATMTGKWVNLKPVIREATQRALGDACEFLLDEMNKIVPHDEGFLESTGDYEIDPQEATAIISYNTPYAVRLHEHPEYNFQNGRCGKWVEITINKYGDQAMKYLAQALKEVM